VLLRLLGRISQVDMEPPSGGAFLAAPKSGLLGTHLGSYCGTSALGQRTPCAHSDQENRNTKKESVRRDAEPTVTLHAKAADG
jgi:hypothetical protein